MMSEILSRLAETLSLLFVKMRNEIVLSSNERKMNAIARMCSLSVSVIVRINEDVCVEKEFAGITCHTNPFCSKRQVLPQLLNGKKVF